MVPGPTPHQARQPALTPTVAGMPCTASDQMNGLDLIFRYQSHITNSCHFINGLSAPKLIGF